MFALQKKILDKIKRDRLFEKDDRLILACSGGPDSVALLDILARLNPVFNLKITVVYYNHRLRPVESERERAYVEKLSREYGLGFASGGGDVKSFAKKNRVSIQEAARYLRYNFLFELGKKLDIQKIVLGHHRDDIVETILLGLFKGGGLKTFSGIETVRQRGNSLLIRPMCEIAKKEIIFYLSRRKLKPCMDASNLKKTYLRNRLRLKILPVLRKDINPRVDDAVLRLSEIYSKENEYLDGVVSKILNGDVLSLRAWQSRICIDKKKFLKLHEALARRILREVFSVLGIIGEGGNFRQIELLRNFISFSHPGRKLDLARGFNAKSGYGQVIIEKDPIRDPCRRQGRHLRGLISNGVKLNVPGETVIKDLDIKIQACIAPGTGISAGCMKNAFPEKVFFDAEKIKLPLYIRTKRTGDSFRPFGMEGTVKLKKYFINARILQEERRYIPLVVSGREIICIVGYAISEKVKVTPYTKSILTLERL